MALELPTINRAAVFASAVVYWFGVWIQARRVRKRIGRSPNVRPHGLKEKLLWVGWAFVVLNWLTLPLLPGLPVIPALVHPLGSALGLLMMGAGYGGTLWCYVAMGSAWRMGINRAEKTQLVTQGPYRWVRHPIYLFQIVMVAAVAVLLPSTIALAVLVVHLVCVLTKAADEEAFLRTLLGQDYKVYRAHTGAWLPPLFGRSSPAISVPSADLPPFTPEHPPSPERPH